MGLRHTPPHSAGQVGRLLALQVMFYELSKPFPSKQLSKLSSKSFHLSKSFPCAIIASGWEIEQVAHPTRPG
jgi:hypothetical protein